MFGLDINKRGTPAGDVKALAPPPTKDPRAASRRRVPSRDRAARHGRIEQIPESLGLVTGIAFVLAAILFQFFQFSSAERRRATTRAKTRASRPSGRERPPARRRPRPGRPQHALRLASLRRATGRYLEPAAMAQYNAALFSITFQVNSAQPAVLLFSWGGEAGAGAQHSQLSAAARGQGLRRRCGREQRGPPGGGGAAAARAGRKTPFLGRFFWGSLTTFWTCRGA